MMKNVLEVGLLLLLLVTIGGCGNQNNTVSTTISEAKAALQADNTALAHGLCLTLSKRGNAWGQRCLGNLAQASFQFHSAVQWYRKAVAQGDAPAMFELGMLYDSGLGVAMDADKAAELWRKSAAKGNVHAQFALAQDYERGRGVEQNLSRAIKIHHKAAAQGFVKSQFHLCEAYYSGNGVQQSYTTAARWCRKAAALGSANAQYDLGMLYDHGYGVPKSHGIAIRWWERAAAQGHTRALNNLGMAYESGHGVPRDLIMAYALYDCSEAINPLNDVPALNRVRVGRVITQAQRRFAEQIKREMLKPGQWESVYKRRKHRANHDSGPRGVSL